MLALLNMVDPDIPVKVPIEVLGLGSLMLVIIVLIHGAGLDRILGLYERRSEVYRLRFRHPYLATSIFAVTILLMLFLHVFEICVWGVALNRTGLITSVRDSMYFSANTYTTIGYGLMILPYNWRELSPLMAISGLFTFAWTTSTLVDVVRSHGVLVKQLEDERAKQMQLRADARMAVRDAVSIEKAAERAEKAQFKQDDLDVPLLGRLRRWKQERRKIEELRAAERSDIEKILRKEHQDEDALGPGVPPPDSEAKKPK